MPRKETIVDFDEIFRFAEEKYNMEWNYCCDIFHRNPILCNDEGKDVTIDLEEFEETLKSSETEHNPYFSEKDKIGYPVVISFMKKNNLKEMRVLNDF